MSEPSDGFKVEYYEGARGSLHFLTSSEYYELLQHVGKNAVTVSDEDMS